MVEVTPNVMQPGGFHFWPHLGRHFLATIEMFRVGEKLRQSELGNIMQNALHGNPELHTFEEDEPLMPQEVFTVVVKGFAPSKSTHLRILLIDPSPRACPPVFWQSLEQQSSSPFVVVSSVWHRLRSYPPLRRNRGIDTESNELRGRNTPWASLGTQNRTSGLRS